ncbi:hypothetical protein [Streptomyces sp. C1-2]|uniref:hypothetical protein n=1 Tax=Streptomyces sp. C1-2 TaxID=2720022 RepID=UPI0014326689|nr:hypothetical protein [Streptomyces sp. C1-2]NJP70684.1 hypothetical protein [Streptomyces sp. C1-2]
MRTFAFKRYELRAEFYRAEYVQNPDSGSFEWVYDYDNPEYIRCTGGSVRPWGSIQDFADEYRYKDYLELFSPTEVTLSGRIGKVSNKNGNVLWREDDGTPTTFDVFGCFPVNDANGRTIDYRILVARSEVV